MLGRRLAVSLSIPVVLAALIPALSVAAPPRRAPRPVSQSFENLRRLDVNRLNLYVSNYGWFGYNASQGSPGLFYPRGDGRSLLFAGGLWIGDEASGRVTVAEYSSEYTPGRIIASVPEDPNAPGLIVYKVVRWTGDPADSAHVERTPKELALDPNLDPLAHHSWSEYVSNAGSRGAPVRIYRLPVTATPDPADSVDVPGPDVLGDQMLWSVYNDADPAAHNSVAGSTLPLRVEVQQTWYAFDRAGPLGVAAYVRYRIVNHSGTPAGTRFVGVWADPDLGASGDDYIGSDVNRHMAYVYNRTSDAIYGADPPALGVRMFPFAYSATAYMNGTDPQDPTESLNALRGLRPDGSPMLDPVANAETRFTYPGNPVTESGWLDGAAADKRFLVSTVVNGDTAIVEGAIVVGQGSSPRSSISVLDCFSDFVASALASGFEVTEPGDEGPCPPPPSCAQPPSVWEALCTAGQPGLAELAQRIDSQSTYFDWSDDLAGFCAAVSSAGSGPRRSAEREYAALLANLLAPQVPVFDAEGDSIILDPSTPAECAPFAAATAGELIDPGTRARELTAVEYHDDSVHARNLHGVSFGLSFFDGGAGYARDLFGSTLDPDVSPDSFPTVELRFLAGPGQKGYRYLRHEVDGTGGAPPDGRVYSYAGFHTLPFEAWDVDRGVRLEVGFVERALTDEFGTLLPSAQQPATHDSTWNPDTTVIGGREYLFVFRRDYSGVENPSLAVTGAATDGLHSVLYAFVAARNSIATPFDDAGDTVRFVFGRPVVRTADGLMIQLEDLDLNDPEVAAAYDEAVACIGPLNRICNRVTPVLASLSAVAEPDGVLLSGWAPGLLTVTVERRSGSESWREVARVPVDGRGAWQWRDADVQSGGQYGYRLRVAGHALGETWVTVAGSATLSLLGATPNPGGADAVVRFTLPRRTPAQLELIDIAGRRVAKKEVGELGPGVHALRIDEWKKLPPGVYLLRLTQGASVSTARVVRIR